MAAAAFATRVAASEGAESGKSERHSLHQRWYAQLSAVEAEAGVEVAAEILAREENHQDVEEEGQRLPSEPLLPGPPPKLLVLGRRAAGHSMTTKSQGWKKSRTERSHAVGVEVAGVEGQSYRQGPIEVEDLEEQILAAHASASDAAVAARAQPVAAYQKVGTLLEMSLANTAAAAAGADDDADVAGAGVAPGSKASLLACLPPPPLRHVQMLRRDKLDDQMLPDASRLTAPRGSGDGYKHATEYQHGREGGG